MLFNRRNEVAQRRMRNHIHETDEVVGKVRVEQACDSEKGIM
jgi:hypothetical protein